MGRTTDRDRAIVRLIARHRTFTTDQLTRLFFTNPATARHRLTILWRLRLLDRFRPMAANASATGLHASSYCYVLDELGGWQVHLEAGRDPDRFRWRPRRHGDPVAYATSQQLAHRLGVNEFFTRLHARARHDPNANLRVWRPEAACDHIPDRLRLRPDGYGLWHQHGRQVPFHLEWDRGTEPLAELTSKLHRYGDLETSSVSGGHLATWVLICLPSPRREQHLRQALTNTEVRAPTATTVLQPDLTPDAPIWRPVLDVPHPSPVSLIDLEGLPLPPALIRAVRERLDHERWWQQEGYPNPLLSPEQLAGVTTYLDAHDPATTRVFTPNTRPPSHEGTST